MLRPVNKIALIFVVKIFLQRGGLCEDEEQEVEYIPVATTDRGELYVDC